MSQPISEPVAPSILALSPMAPVTLWKPGFIAIVTFFLGFPAGIGLAVINWFRMGEWDKAVHHIIAGSAGTLMVILLLEGVPRAFGTVLGWGISLACMFYLQRQMTNDINRFKQENHAVKDANWLGGCLVGLGLLVLFIFAAVTMAILLALLGIRISK